MSFSAYITFVAGSILTAAQLNQQVRDNGNVVITSLDTATGKLNSTGGVLATPQLRGYNETKTSATISAGVLTIDFAAANHYSVSLNANITTLTINNWPTTGFTGMLSLYFLADGTLRTITWPAAVKWVNGTAPTMTSTNNKWDIVTLITFDAGTTIFGLINGQNL